MEKTGEISRYYIVMYCTIESTFERERNSYAEVVVEFEAWTSAGAG